MDDTFQCDYCTAIFNYPVDIENHIYTHLRSTDDAPTIQHTKGKRPMVDDDEKKGKTQRRTPKPFSTNANKGDKRKRSSKKSNVSAKDESVNVRTVGDCDESIGKCCICDMNFTNCFDYQTHVENESISMELQCCRCHMFFENSELLESHSKANRCNDLEIFTSDPNTDALDYEFCAECGSHFQNKNLLAKHYTKEDCWKFKEREGISYQCGKCDEKFATFNDWSSHEDTHIPAKHFRCAICLLALSTISDYNKHIKLIHEKVNITGGKRAFVYKCAKCKKDFDSALNLLNHDKTHLDLKPFKCFACPKSFSYNFPLRKHRELAHGQISEDMVKIMNKAQQYRVFSEHEKQFRCPICRSEFSKRMELRLHKLTEHEGGTCFICNKPILKPSEFKHHVAAHIGVTQCLFCNASFHNKEMLSTHMPCNVSPFSCKRCGESFPDVAHLGLHSHRKDKTNKKPRYYVYLCELCGWVSLGNYRFNRHQRSHFKKTKEFECTDCKSKHFSYKSLMKHRIIHHDEEQAFKCEICNQKFSSTFGVKMHLRLHRRGTQPQKDPVFECNKCDQTFLTKALLKRHGNVHMYDSKPYKCDQCEVAFTLSCNLTKHKVVHTGEKPYPCVTCKAAFNHRSSLIKHSYIHTRNYPYNCDECEIGFVDRKSFVRHTQRHHGPGISKYLQKK